MFAGDTCHATRPCGNGLSCQPGVHRCYHSPRQYEEPCIAGHECGDGLSCHPGVHKCYHSPRRHKEPCAAGQECGPNLKCAPILQICVYSYLPIYNGDACRAIYDPVTAFRAKFLGLTIAMGGTLAYAGFYTHTWEWGAVYGGDDEYACYETECSGGTLEVSVAVGYSVGFYGQWDDFAGDAMVALVGGSVPVIKVAAVTGTVFTMPGVSPSRHLGQTAAFSVGTSASVAPVSAAVLHCNTRVAVHVDPTRLDLPGLPIRSTGASIQVCGCTPPIRTSPPSL
jgi:hypothetical protein